MNNGNVGGSFTGFDFGSINFDPVTSGSLNLTPTPEPTQRGFIGPVLQPVAPSGNQAPAIASGESTQAAPLPSPSTVGGGTANISGTYNQLLEYNQQLADEQTAQEARNRDLANKAIDAAFANEQGSLDVLEGDLRNTLPITLEEITNSYNAELPGIQRAQDTAISDLGQQERQVGFEQQKGFRTARQIFDELMSFSQGARGSAGAGVGELIGRDIANIVGGVREKAATALVQISGEVKRVNEFYNNTKSQLERDKQAALRRARNAFQTELAKIRESRSQSERNKALARAGVYTQFQNQASQILQASALQNMELEKWKVDKQNTLNRAANFTYNDMQQYVGGIGQVATIAQQFNYELTDQDIQAMATGPQGQVSVINRIMQGGPQDRIGAGAVSVPGDETQGGLIDPTLNGILLGEG